jgi:hypothetical protein
MRTIQLKVNEEVYDKLIWLLNKFSIDELEIIADNERITPFESGISKPADTQSEYDKIEKNLENALKRYKRQ